MDTLTALPAEVLGRLLASPGSVWLVLAVAAIVAMAALLMGWLGCVVAAVVL